MAAGLGAATRSRQCERGTLGELLNVDFDAMSLMNLCRLSGVLMGHRKALEVGLFVRVSKLFGLDWTLTL